MIHRHLDLPDELAPEELPSPAVLDLLERGDLEEWRPLLAALLRAPYGKLAARVERLVDLYPMYGTSQLVRRWLERCRARGRPYREPLMLREVRLGLGLTQAALAERLGISQSDTSKLERRADVRVSTLRAVARAIGGALHLVFEVDAPDGRREVELRLGQRSSVAGVTGSKRSEPRRPWRAINGD